MGKHALSALSLASCMTLGYGSEIAEYNDAPLRDHWAPGEWGEYDNIGAVNRITQELVLKSVELVRQGKIATLGKVYSSDMPLYGGRTWEFSIRGLPPEQAWGAHRGVAIDDHLSASIGQVGTQFDGPGHIGVMTSKGHYFYNGHYLSDDRINEDGMGPLGVEHVAQKGFVCRGVLLDAVALRGDVLRPPRSASDLDPGIVTARDIDAMVEGQGIAPIREGDCVFLHTGHGDLWHPSLWDTFSADEKSRRAAEFHAGTPGFGISACEYLADRGVILTGSDNWMSEATGFDGRGERGEFIECHVLLQTKHGIWNMENLDLSQLVEDQVYEFMFVWAPLKIKGGTGSPGNPMAIY